MWIEKVSKRFVVACVIFIMGIVLIVKEISANIDEHKEFYDYNSLSSTDISEGIMISGEITESYGLYDRMGDRSGSYYYAIPTTDGKILGIRVTNDEGINTLDAIARGNTGSYEFYGKVKKMNKDSQENLLAKMSHWGFTKSEAEQKLAPYYIEIIYRDSKEAILIAALITLFSGAVIVVSILTRKKRYKL